jgi:hypothetical protein
MSRMPTAFHWMARSPGDFMSLQRRRVALLGALLLAASFPADGTAGGVRSRIDPRTTNVQDAAGRRQMVFRRRTRGKG